MLLLLSCCLRWEGIIWLPLSKSVSNSVNLFLVWSLRLLVVLLLLLPALWCWVQQRDELARLRAGCDFCICLLGFPLKSKWNDWWLRKAQRTPTGFWVWLTCLRRRRAGMGVGGCRDMEFGWRRRWTESVSISAGSNHHSCLWRQL